MSDVSIPTESVADLNYRLGFTYGKEEGIREVGAKLFEMRQLVIDAHRCKIHDLCCEDCRADTGECPVERHMRDLGMANCMTCRHNDKKTKYCPVKKAHTDLEYSLNCVAWEPTDEYTMNELRTKNCLTHCDQECAS